MAGDIQEMPFVKQLAANGEYLRSNVARLDCNTLIKISVLGSIYYQKWRKYGHDELP